MEIVTKPRNPDAETLRLATAAFPSLADFESKGIPLAASEPALRILGDLHEFLPMVNSVRATRASMLSALGAYNNNLDRHHPLTFADALWGRLVVDTSNFDTNCGLHVAPVANLVNHSTEPNVEYSCGRGMGDVQLAATRDIAAGEELTAACHADQGRIACGSRNTNSAGGISEKSGQLHVNPKHRKTAIRSIQCKSAVGCKRRRKGIVRVGYELIESVELASLKSLTQRKLRDC